MHERRTNRSQSPYDAARLFLQSVMARRGLAALALTNDDGLLIAGAAAPGTDLDDLAWIGAVGCVCALPGRRGPSLGSLVERITGGRQLTAAELVLRGERLYLTAVGGPLPPGREVVAGIERILAASLPAAA
jgi:hypothetical protein